MQPSLVFAMALGAAIGCEAYILPYPWMQEAGLSGTVNGFVVGTLSASAVTLVFRVTWLCGARFMTSPSARDFYTPAPNELPESHGAIK